MAHVGNADGRCHRVGEVRFLLTDERVDRGVGGRGGDCDLDGDGRESHADKCHYKPPTQLADSENTAIWPVSHP
jgi:hypothetical protein